MKFEALQKTLTTLGVYTDNPKDSQMTLALKKSNSLLSFKKKLTIASSAERNEAPPTSKESKAVRKEVLSILKGLEKHSDKIHSAGDLQKINNLKSIVSKSSSLLQSHKDELKARFEALEPEKQLRIDQQYLRCRERRMLATNSDITTMNHTPYAQMMQYTTEGAGRNHSEQVASMFSTKQDAHIKSQVEVLQEVKAKFQPQNADEQRMLNYLNHLESEAAKGNEVALPKYYHCTKADGLHAIASEGRVYVHTPRTGTGAGGAWISTNPQTASYGKNIVALSHRVDFTHDSAMRGHYTPPLENAKGGINIGLQQHIYITPQGASGGKTPLSLIGIDDADPMFEERKSSFREMLGSSVSFASESRKEDVAIFKTSTVLRLYDVLSSVQRSLIPKHFWK
ncbi:hypothetical protein [Halodesulfovibrio spirochaetisodalis]|uniref:Uncharacterized protein n=1 Tax=Halodesulfovibrio spirochaetisodalis TaxID=1560234 RepID=A0A1B7X9K6_9BACT|nr:hypothetical protein [Halodesulfovibrio spirochaetisodalis]OBQ46054.1 hypothetical protein SP90_14235 [Halodesulfovibrio spirochaetisodalis]